MKTLWGNIIMKGAGLRISEEESSQVYYDNSEDPSLCILKEGKYKDFTYLILTFGDYPVLDIRVKNLSLPLLEGQYGSLILKLNDGKKYELNHVQMNVTDMKLIYEFNKPDDYIYGKDHGIKYSILKIEDYARQFIDNILDNENIRKTNTTTTNYEIH